MIKLKFDNKEYLLGYNRRTVKQMERMGFSLNKFDDKITINTSLLFQGAFLMNHPKVKNTDAILEEVPNKSELIGALAEEYADTMNNLVGDSDEGNATWEVI